MKNLEGYSNAVEELDRETPCRCISSLLCMEVFHNQLIKETNNNNSGIEVKICPRTAKIPCLLFADDFLMFCKTNKSTCVRLKHILDHFCDISGQLVIIISQCSLFPIIQPCSSTIGYENLQHITP